MVRKAVKKLLKWKESKDRKPLMLYGLRQVGKSWLMKEFGAKYYKNTVYITFDNNPSAKATFNSDFDVKRIIRELEIEADTTILPGETLIILDEIQVCPRAVTSLKYFNEDAPQYHVMTAGSLLGVMNLAQDEENDEAERVENTGFPVGKTDRMTLYPMNFIEFLIAVGEERFAKLIENLDFKTVVPFAQKISDLMTQYFIVGGMPAAVKKYAESRSFQDVRDVHYGLINDYYADFAKHVPKWDIAKTRRLWENVPLQLGKENRRFLYSDMKKGSRGRDYETALQWLIDAGMVSKVNRVSQPHMPLNAYMEEAIFKLYMPDTGLLSTLTGLDPRVYIEPNNAIFHHYKGVLAEQFALQEIRASNTNLQIYFWASEANKAEIEFVVQANNKIIPIEVKAGKNTKSESLRSYISRKDFAASIAVRTSLNDYRVADNIYNSDCVLYDIPLYMIGGFERVIFDANENC
ncbi:MAG: ATP-binding protein [Chitinispirillia bacterium]|nr:ATP-binding protein [Chitinispirillia bacterium]